MTITVVLEFRQFPSSWELLEPRITTMSVPCNYFHSSNSNLLFPRNLPYFPPTSPTHFTPYKTNKAHSIISHSFINSSSNNTSKTSRNRFNGVVPIRAVVSEEEEATGSTSSSTPGIFRLTYLEGNSWLWDVDGVKFLVDPILVGNLDFGIPWLYDAAKKFVKNFQLSDLPAIDYLLITQSLDDHCHLKTLRPLSQMSPDLKVIATPNAKSLLDPLFKNVSYLEPGESCEVEGSTGTKVRVKATAGPVLGPPWQRPENGYLVSSERQMTLYYEPHCVYNKSFVEKDRADIVITPVIKVLLPNFTLVSGQEDAVQLAKLLNARYVVPMKNGDLDSKGFLASIIAAEGTTQSFKELLSKELPDAQVLEPTPGEPLQI